MADLLATVPGVSWDRLLFSAKESVYKAWFPLTSRWLNFSAGLADRGPAARTFAARLLVSATTPGRAAADRLRPAAGWPATGWCSP